MAADTEHPEEKPGKSGAGKILRRVLVALVCAFALFSALVYLNEAFGFTDIIPSWRQIYAALDLNRTPDFEQVEGDVSVHFIDVGQGDCALICAEGKNVLIDCGEYDQYGAVSAYLKALGVRTLDLVIMSHPHSDHMGCMYKIIEKYGAETLMMPKLRGDMIPVTSSFTRLIDAAEENGVSIEYAVPGSTVALGENSSIFIAAPLREYDDLNNSSVTAKFTYKDVSFLFCGDIEEEAELDILESRADISADVLKVPHHGSETSAKKIFVQAVAPKYAVFCCGQENDYGHPHNSVVKLYQKLGVQLYRTDMHGTVVFVTDGDRIGVVTEKER